MEACNPFLLYKPVEGLILFEMTLTATKFTPEVMLSAPRRSAGRPNSTGTKVLFTVSTSRAAQLKTAPPRVA